MTFRGHIHNGRFVADSKIDLPNGTEAVVSAEGFAKPKRKARSATSGKSAARQSRSKSTRKTMGELLAPLRGIVKGLPRDAAVNHDHYLYGSPKKR